MAIRNSQLQKTLPPHIGKKFKKVRCMGQKCFLNVAISGGLLNDQLKKRRK